MIHYIVGICKREEMAFVIQTTISLNADMMLEIVVRIHSIVDLLGVSFAYVEILTTQIVRVNGWGLHILIIIGVIIKEYHITVQINFDFHDSSINKFCFLYCHFLSNTIYIWRSVW